MTEPTIAPTTLDDLARALIEDRLDALGLSSAVAEQVWRETLDDPGRLAEARAHARRIIGLARDATTPGGEAHRGSAVWRVLDWALWGAGCGDEIREQAADIMTAALPNDLREEICAIEDAWRRHRSTHPAHAELAALRAAARAVLAHLQPQDRGYTELATALSMQPKSKTDD